MSTAKRTKAPDEALGTPLETSPPRLVALKTDEDWIAYVCLDPPVTLRAGEQATLIYTPAHASPLRSPLSLREVAEALGLVLSE